MKSELHFFSWRCVLKESGIAGVVALQDCGSLSLLGSVSRWTCGIEQVNCVIFWSLLSCHLMTPVTLESVGNRAKLKITFANSPVTQEEREAKTCRREEVNQATTGMDREARLSWL
jgi:hypothetical protein